MKPKQYNVWLDPEIRDAIKPLLKRDGLTLASFFRKAMLDYLEQRSRVNSVFDIGDIEGLR